MLWKRKKNNFDKNPLSPFNPDVGVAGFSVVGNGYAPLEPAHHEMCRRLKTDNSLVPENVLFMHSVQDDKVFFVAARERDFSGPGVYASQLGAALPGGPAYKGSGAYLDVSTPVPAMLLIDGDRLAYRKGSRVELERQAGREGLPVILLDDIHLTEWVSFNSHTASSAWSRLRGLAYIGAFACAASFVIAGFAAWKMATAEYAEQSQTSVAEVLRGQLKAELRRVSENPLGVQIQQLERIQKVALQVDDGVLHYWKLDAESGVSFKLSMSPHVLPSSYEALGQLTAVETVNGRLVLTKASPRKGAPGAPPLMNKAPQATK